MKIQSLEQLNRDFMEQREPQQHPHPLTPLSLPQVLPLPQYPEQIHTWASTNETASKKHRLSTRICIICIACLVLFVTTLAVLHSTGYSWFRVVSGSMQREIPEGSMVVTRRADESQIKVGDTIAYERKNQTVITHKVVGIIENFGGSEFRGFVTQGTENAAQDQYTVPSSKVVGVVVWSAPGMGSAIILFEKAFLFLLIAVIITTMTAATMRRTKKGGTADARPSV